MGGGWVLCQCLPGTQAHAPDMAQSPEAAPYWEKSMCGGRNSQAPQSKRWGGTAYGFHERMTMSFLCYLQLSKTRTGPVFPACLSHSEHQPNQAIHTSLASLASLSLSDLQTYTQKGKASGHSVFQVGKSVIATRVESVNRQLQCNSSTVKKNSIHPSFF